MASGIGYSAFSGRNTSLFKSTTASFVFEQSNVPSAWQRTARLHQLEKSSADSYAKQKLSPHSVSRSVLIFRLTETKQNENKIRIQIGKPDTDRTRCAGMAGVE